MLAMTDGDPPPATICSVYYSVYKNNNDDNDAVSCISNSNYRYLDSGLSRSQCMLRLVS